MEIQSSYIQPDAINGEQQLLNRITDTPSRKEQLKKTSEEFESIFISKMFSVMDESVNRDEGIFGDETKYMDKFKSYMYNELGRQLSSNPQTSFGFAKQIYSQMERFVKD